MAGENSGFGISEGFQDIINQRQIEAQTLLQAAQAAKYTQEATQEARMLQVLGQRQPPQVDASGQAVPAKPEDLVSRVESNAQRLLDAGMYKAGTDMAGKASLMRQQKAAGEASQASARLRRVHAEETQLKQVNSMLASIRTPQDFEAAKMAHMAANPDQPLPPQFAYYNPALFAQIRQGTEQGLKVLKAEREQLTADGMAEARANLQKHRLNQENVAERRLTLLREREERMKKNGGSAGKGAGVGVPSRDFISAAEAEIAQDFPGLAADMKLGNSLASKAAFDVASEAKAKMTANRALSAKEALSQAYQEAKQRGDFSLEPGKTFLGFSTQKPKSTYKAGGGAAALTPIPLPADRKLIAGQAYQTPKGVIVWNGKVGVPYTPKASTSPIESVDDEDEEE